MIDENNLPLEGYEGPYYDKVNINQSIYNAQIPEENDISFCDDLENKLIDLYGSIDNIPICTLDGTVEICWYLPPQKQNK